MLTNTPAVALLERSLAIMEEEVEQLHKDIDRNDYTIGAHTNHRTRNEQLLRELFDQIGEVQKAIVTLRTEVHNR